MTMPTPPTPPTQEPPAPASETDLAPAGRLVIEYWTVAMAEQDSCGSCDTTLALLNDTVEQMQPMAGRLGIALQVQVRTVTTWPEAVDHGITSSPTIRAAGQELRPQHSDDSEARTWTWRGQTHTSLAPEAVLDLLLHAVAVRSREIGDYLSAGGPAPYVRQFLQAAPVLEMPVAERGCG